MDIRVPAFRINLLRISMGGFSSIKNLIVFQKFKRNDKETGHGSVLYTFCAYCEVEAIATFKLLKIEILKLEKKLSLKF